MKKLVLIERMNVSRSENAEIFNNSPMLLLVFRIVIFIEFIINQFGKTISDRVEIFESNLLHLPFRNVNVSRVIISFHNII